MLPISLEVRSPTARNEPFSLLAAPFRNAADEPKALQKRDVQYPNPLTLNPKP